jgi:hypothetical protein
VDATYTPVAASNRGILAFDLIVQNDDDVPARLGCGMSIALKDRSGIKTVAYGACLATESASHVTARDGDISPRSSDTVRVARNISSADFGKDATYRVALSIAFEPTFKTGFPFSSNWFKPVEKREQSIQEIRRLLSDLRR